METIEISTEYITLGQFLVFANICATGGQTKFFLIENEVLVEGEKENRRGRKLYPGMKVSVQSKVYLIGKKDAG